MLIPRHVRISWLVSLLSLVCVQATLASEYVIEVNGEDNTESLKGNSSSGAANKYDFKPRNSTTVWFSGFESGTESMLALRSRGKECPCSQARAFLMGEQYAHTGRNALQVDVTIPSSSAWDVQLLSPKLELIAGMGLWEILLLA